MSTEKTPEQHLLDAVDADGNGVRLGLFRSGDRFAHIISLVASGRASPLLASEEDDGEDPWPCSPPLQQLNIEGQGDERHMLLIGMAGTSHWSVSIQRSVQESGRPALVFDVACRVKMPPRRLGSSYLPMISPVADAVDSRLAALTTAGTTCHVAVEPLQGSAAELAVSSTNLAVGVPWGDETLPHTFRWRYRMSLADAPVSSDSGSS